MRLKYSGILGLVNSREYLDNEAVAKSYVATEYFTGIQNKFTI